MSVLAFMGACCFPSSWVQSNCGHRVVPAAMVDVGFHGSNYFYVCHLSFASFLSAVKFLSKTCVAHTASVLWPVPCPSPIYRGMGHAMRRHGGTCTNFQPSMYIHTVQVGISYQNGKSSAMLTKKDPPFPLMVVSTRNSFFRALTTSACNFPVLVCPPIFLKTFSLT